MLLRLLCVFVDNLCPDIRGFFERMSCPRFYFGKILFLCPPFIFVAEEIQFAACKSRLPDKVARECVCINVLKHEC